MAPGRLHGCRSALMSLVIIKAEPCCSLRHTRRCVSALSGGSLLRLADAATPTRNTRLQAFERRSGGKTHALCSGSTSDRPHVYECCHLDSLSRWRQCVVGPDGASLAFGCSGTLLLLLWPARHQYRAAQLLLRWGVVQQSTSRQMDYNLRSARLHKACAGYSSRHIYSGIIMTWS